MPPASLAGAVHESKAQRQERLKSRFRDRGGIFVPSDGNALADILLARGINGESPKKKRTPHKKSTLTPKTRAPSASRALGSKTPRTGAPKRASRKSVAAPSDADENNAPPAKKRRGTSKRAKLPEGRKTPGMDTGTGAGPSRSRATAQQVPFANQLADAINTTKTQTVLHSSSDKPPVTPVPPPLGNNERTIGKRNAQATAALPPRYSAEIGPSDRASECTAKQIKSPLFLLLEKQQRQKQDAQRRARGIAAPVSEPVESHALQDLDGSESDDSDLPLALKHAKRTSTVAESHTKLNRGKGSASRPSTKRKSKAKALALRADPPDEVANCTETIRPPKAKKGSASAERDANHDTVTLAARRRKVAPDVDDDISPPPLKARVGANSNGKKKAQVLQEKSMPANAPRKRKERIKTLLDPSARDENEHEPPRKKSRGTADPSTTKSRGAKENKEMSRSAREAARIAMDKPLPSPVKQPAARPKPASEAKKPASSRAGPGVAQAPRSRGLPLNVLRRIKVNALALPALNDIDDDDPIDFLRS